jgi:hypothetical protein
VLPLNDLQILGNPKDLETFIQMEFHIVAPPSGQYPRAPARSRNGRRPTSMACRTRRLPRSTSRPTRRA